MTLDEIEAVTKLPEIFPNIGVIHGIEFHSGSLLLRYCNVNSENEVQRARVALVGMEYSDLDETGWPSKCSKMHLSVIWDQPNFP